jgi:[acyl-carrier-protein] S-malonyltransferase
VTIAFLFPGQGSHRAGALAAWTDHPAAAILDEVAAGVGRDVVALSEDPDAGGRTADAQPAILAASLVVWRALTDAGIAPGLVAGHSLGEFTAAIAAGSLSVRDGAALVAARGAAMGEACAANPGTMAAVVKLGPDAVEVLVEGIEGLVIANDNAPGQVVVAGTPEAVASVRDQARDAGGRALPLDVEGAFHSPAMAPAVEVVAARLAELEVRDPVVPLVSGTTASALEDAVGIAGALVDGILSPVRWREVQLELARLGVTEVVEVGPGGVLAGLAKRTIPDVRVTTVATPDDLLAALEVLRPALADPALADPALADR